MKLKRTFKKKLNEKICDLQISQKSFVKIPLVFPDTLKKYA